MRVSCVCGADVSGQHDDSCGCGATAEQRVSHWRQRADAWRAKFDAEFSNYRPAKPHPMPWACGICNQLVLMAGDYDHDIAAIREHRRGCSGPQTPRRVRQLLGETD